MLFKTNFKGMEEVDVTTDMLINLKPNGLMSWYHHTQKVYSPIMKILSVDMDNKYIEMEMAEFTKTI